MKKAFKRVLRLRMLLQLLVVESMSTLLIGFICLVSGTPALANDLAFNCSLDAITLNKGIDSNCSMYWKSFPGTIFNGKELYHYMNGGADEYLNAGCICLFVKRFEGSGQQHAILEIYEFDNKTGLNQIYARNAGKQPIEIGEAGSVSGNSYLAFRQGRFLCRILSFKQKEKKKTIELGEAAEIALSDQGTINLYSVETKLPMKIIKSDRIVIIGASYAKGWALENLLGMDVINKGVGGEQTGEMLARFQEDVIGNNPEIVIIWGFINDIFRSKKALINEKMEQAKINIEKMVEFSLQNGIKPIVATEVTIRAKDNWKEKSAALIGKILGKQSYQAYVNEKVMEVNRWIKQYAQTNDLLLLDLQAALSDKKGWRKKEYATPDGSHISPGGYKRLTEYTREKLKDFF